MSLRRVTLSPVSVKLRRVFEKKRSSDQRGVRVQTYRVAINTSDSSKRSRALSIAGAWVLAPAV